MAAVLYALMAGESLILGLISDLYFISRVEVAAKQAGFRFEWRDGYQTVPDFLQLLREQPPSLIVLDLNSSLPWPEWLPAAKADATLSQIPWLAFGSHMNPRRLAAARHAGADKVVPKSQFTAELSELIGTLVRK